MTNFGSIEEILEFAIGEEIAANKFYLELAGRAKNPAIREAFEEFAAEELGHKARLENIKKSSVLPQTEKVADLKVSDYLVAGEAGAEMDYQDALILAMKKEKAAYKLYHQLAAIIEDESLREVFLSLAQEEAKHKLRFEIEYDEVILKDN